MTVFVFIVAFILNGVPLVKHSGGVFEFATEAACTEALPAERLRLEAVVKEQELNATIVDLQCVTWTKE